MIPRVLVLLAAHNGAHWIVEQIDSILRQEDVEVFILVGDDASTDGTRDFVATRWGSDPRLELIDFASPSGSAGASFRRLMCAASSLKFDAVALADQDDWWFPDKLSAAIEILEKSGAAGYSCSVRAHWPNGQESIVAQCSRARRADFLFEGAGQGCTFVLRRDFFEHIQLFLGSEAGASLTMHFHDWMLYVLSRAWGLSWTFDPVVRMNYRQHGGNEIGARGGWIGLTRRLRKIRNGWYSEQVVRACRVYVAAGGNDPIVLDFVRNLEQGRSRTVADSIQLGLRFIIHGRRRVADRMVLFFAATARWI